MKAMILAAGFGTRLGPLTSRKPKALVPVGNKPVIDRVIQSLKQHSISKIVVNAHHHHDQVVKHLDDGRPYRLDIRVLVEREILGTGGGIKNAEHFLGSDPFVVINGDILTNINLTEAFKAHLRNPCLATLILHNYEPFNQVQIDDRLNITDIAAENHPQRLAFTGIHIIEPKLLTHIPEGVFSNIINCYRELIHSGKPVKAYISKGHYWRDIGTVDSYIRANREDLGKKHLLLGPGHQIHPSARIEDWAVIGEKACLEEGVEIKRSILWEKVRIKKGRRVIDSIVTSLREVEIDLREEIF
jgi:NDP-sugar pyrophosphorylase family protein